MKYLTFSFLVLMLACGVEIKAQGEAANNGGNNPCDQYKIGIITPSKDIDFKLIIVAPPKNIDTAMVINPCQAHSQVASAPPQIVSPPKETSEFFKVPPFTIKNRYYSQEVSLRF